MAIYKALIKHGYSNFSLEIIEYCEPSLAVSREQYYLDLLKPEYNVLQIAGSSLGFKHSDETIAKMKARVWSDEHKAKRLEGLKTLNASPESRERLLNYNAARSTRVEVLDILNGNRTEYPSVREAARAIECADTSIGYVLKILNQKGEHKAIKNRYLVRPLSD